MEDAQDALGFTSGARVEAGGDSCGWYEAAGVKMKLRLSGHLVRIGYVLQLRGEKQVGMCQERNGGKGKPNNQRKRTERGEQIKHDRPEIRHLPVSVGCI